VEESAAENNGNSCKNTFIFGANNQSDVDTDMKLTG
jgi:hypothetical protein